MRRIAIFIFLLFFCFKAQAAETDLVISEIMYDASGADSGHEWVEILNFGPDVIVASSTWRFFDGSNHNLNLSQGTSTIASQELFVIADNADNFLSDYPDFGGTVFDSVMSLPNTSSTIALSFDSGGTYPVEASYDSSWGGADGYSLEKVSDIWQPACLEGGSPGVLNQECTVEDPPDDEEPEINYWYQIIISEFMPNPAGSDDGEWIELYNLGPEPVDLTGFLLSDDSSRRFTIDEDAGVNLFMPPDSYLVLSKSITGISLNNSSGDSVELYNPDEALQEKVPYTDSALEDRSFARSDSGFVWTKQPTPGQPNNIVENQSPIARISIDGEFNISQKITFSGELSSDPEGDDLDYYWEFGDGETSSKKTIKHKFDQIGNYTIFLTVTDPEAASDTAEYELIIYQPTEEEDETDDDEGDDKEAEEIEYAEIDFSEDDLIISEFIPNPKGSDDFEWIELYNSSGHDIDLNGWYLDDADGGSKPYQFTSSTIAASSFLVVARVDSGITLNNSSDSVRLLKPDSNLWQEVAYEKISEGKTFAWDIENSEWFEAEPSPGAVNLKIIEPEIVYLVSEIKNLAKNDQIVVNGVVINNPDKNTHSIYLADFDGQFINFDNLIEIYSYYKDFPDLKVGELITVSGQLSRVDELPRLKTKSAEQILSSGQIFELDKLGKPDVLSPDDIDSDFLGSLITVKGIVVKKSGKSIYLASDVDEEYNVRVYSKFSTKDLEIKKGLEVIATGILSETDSGFKLEPFTIEDIWASQEVLGEKIESEEVEIEITTSTNQAIVANSVSQNRKILLFLVAGSVVLLVIYLIKKKKQKVVYT